MDLSTISHVYNVVVFHFQNKYLDVPPNRNRNIGLFSKQMGKWGMGDHRASIKIEMEFHGVKDSCDLWINYSPDEYGCMDQRVVEFFKSVYDRGIVKYQEDLNRYFRDRRRKETEASERAELARLKEKYEQPA